MGRAAAAAFLLSSLISVVFQREEGLAVNVVGRRRSVRTRAGLRRGHGGRCSFGYGWINGLVNTHQDAAQMPAMQFNCATDVIHCFREIESAAAVGFQRTAAAMFQHIYLVLALVLYHNATKKHNKKVLKI